MTLSNEVKKNVLAEFGELLRDFSDIEYQQRVWLRGEGPEIDCFADATNDFLDGSFEIAEFVDVLWVEWGLPAEPRASFREFSEALQRFVDQWGHDPEIPSVLGDPEWERVRRLAERACSDFRLWGLVE